MRYVVSIVIIVLIGTVFLINVNWPVEPKMARAGDTYTLVGGSVNPATAHLSGNKFSEQVGKELRDRYPSKVVNPRVSISAKTVGGRPYYEVKWNCEIVNSSTEAADYHFDRRGTLLAGKSVEEAEAAVEREIQSSNKRDELVKSFQHAFKNYSQLVEYGTSTVAPDGQAWYIREIFITARE